MLIAVAATLAACGSDGKPTSERTPTPTPGAPAGNDAGRFPDRPQVDLDFAGADAMPRADGDGRAPAPSLARLGDRGVYVVGTVRSPARLKARAGVFCRGSGDGDGYEFTIDRRGSARLERVEGAKRTLVAGYQARIDAGVPPSAPIPVTLICGTGQDARGAVLGVAVGASQPTFVRDREALVAGVDATAGLIARGGARFGALQVYVAR